MDTGALFGALAWWVSAGVVVVTLVGVAVGRYPGLRMNRATIALTGATALILLGALSLEEAYAALDLDTLTLLFAMMILNVNLRQAGFFELAGEWVVQRAKSPRQLLALLIGTAGVLSALFLNDTIVLVFTPLVLDICAVVERRPLPYLVALVMAANVGSVATITGNPQNMIIGVASGIPFATFTALLTPAAVVGLGIIWVIVAGVYREDFAPVRLQRKAYVPVQIERALLRKSLIATGVMLAGLLLGMPIPLAALAAAALLLISRRIEPRGVFQELDWSLLVFFAGLFMVTGALAHMGIGERLFALVQPLAARGIVALAASGVVLSNLVSNVPAVLLFRPFVPSFPEPTAAWLTLALSTTFAGNLTLLGSVANLIVAEIAMHRGVTLSFGEYLRTGPIVTLLTLVAGVGWLYLIL